MNNGWFPEEWIKCTEYHSNDARSLMSLFDSKLELVQVQDWENSEQINFTQSKAQKLSHED